MALGKWIGGFLGFITAGPLGALAGFALGALFDRGMDQVNTGENPDFQRMGYDQRENRTYGAYGPRAYEGQRNSFMFSLLVLSSYIIKADGKVMHSEMNFVRNFLQQNFGSEAVSQGEDILLKLFKKQDEMGPSEFQGVIRDCCMQISRNMLYEQRLQLLNYLVLVAQADKDVSREEVNALKYIAVHLSLTEADVESMLNLKYGGNDLDAAYKVLGISPEATDEEVKAAYRKLALKNHPDRVATLGDDVRKAAEKKFQEINAAKEVVFKARGIR
ncbi:DnaJ domain-containing protein [Prevotella cerevisiae]|jgi:DnaJ like chaperone protein|uniref:DnaJ domain-containing protein n=1 Tax=Segatella cerevisiae TaxID=2053716 RepID=A0ABT1BXV1_9BACT|nr:DnaJ domain-containing protein [Segatella cerevisiae]MCH3995680.1 DnaJ domain-containing protein [Prevotella sp.]MCO6025886.1 DnaJ domain-containing protein [Segatella cerevisiae]